MRFLDGIAMRLGGMVVEHTICRKDAKFCQGERYMMDVVIGCRFGRASFLKAMSRERWLVGCECHLRKSSRSE
jgi:hypothetical protein